MKKLISSILICLVSVTLCYGDYRCPTTSSSSVKTTTIETTSTVPETTSSSSTIETTSSTVQTTCPTTISTSILTTTSSRLTTIPTSSVVTSTTSKPSTIPTTISTTVCPTTTTSIFECVEGTVWNYSTTGINGNTIVAVTYGFCNGKIYKIDNGPVAVPFNECFYIYTCRTAFMMQLYIDPVSLLTGKLWSWFSESDGLAFQCGIVLVDLRDVDDCSNDWFFTPYAIVYELKKVGTIEIIYDGKPVTEMYYE